MIQSSRNVDTDSSELVVLVLRQSETKPVARDKQSAIPVDVETLMRVPAAGTAAGLLFLNGEFRMMGQNIRFDLHDFSSAGKSRRRQLLRRWMVCKEWIPGLNLAVVQKEFEIETRPDHAMKRNGEMVPHRLCFLKKEPLIPIIVHTETSDQSINVLPDYDSAAAEASEPLARQFSIPIHRTK
jgi:hypothetical protein